MDSDGSDGYEIQEEPVEELSAEDLREWIYSLGAMVGISREEMDGIAANGPEWFFRRHPDVAEGIAGYLKERQNETKRFFVCNINIIIAVISLWSTSHWRA